MVESQPELDLDLDGVRGLIESEAWYRALVERDPAVLVVVGPAGTVDWANPAASRLVGRDPTGSGVEDLAAAADRSRWAEAFADARRHPGSPVVCEIGLGAGADPDRPGPRLEAVLVDLSADPVVGGTVVRLVDVSARATAEHRRRRTEDALRAIIRHSPLGILALDPQGRVRTWNPVCASVLGRPEAAARGAAIDDVAGPGIRPLVARALAGGSVDAERVTLRHAAGRDVDAVVSLVPLDRAVLGVLAVAPTAEPPPPRGGGSPDREEDLARTEARLRSLQAVAAREEEDRRTRTRDLEDREARLADRFAAVETREGALGARAAAIVARAAEIEAEDGDLAARRAAVEAREAELAQRVAQIEALERDLAQRRRVEQARTDRVAVAARVVDAHPDLVLRCTPDLVVTYANRACARGLGREPEELVGTSLLDLVPAGAVEDTRARLTSLGAASPRARREGPWPTMGGPPSWIEWVDHAVVGDDGTVGEIACVGRDASERRRADALRSQHARLLELVASGAPLADTLEALCQAVEEREPGLRAVALLLDDEGRTLRVAGAAGLDAEVLAELDGRSVALGPWGAAVVRGEIADTPDTTVHPDWEPWRDLAIRHSLGACWSRPIRGRRTDDVFGELVVLAPRPGLPTPERHRELELLAEVAALAVERERVEERIAGRSLREPVTGFPNRTLLLDRVGHALARARRQRAAVALLVCDLDRFKVFNESLGHEAGDELIAETGRRLAGAVRPGDTVAHLGGDDFAVLCEDLPAARAHAESERIAGELRAAVGVPYTIGGQETFLDLSVGIAVGLDPEYRPEDLLRDAGAAMSEAKGRGRGRLEVFDEALRERAVARHATESSLHRALERGEFRLFFQPVVDLRQGRCIGAEALVRWQHPERGLLAPAEFIAVAEETGLIVPIGEWVLREAARRAARWHLDAGEPVGVSVNLSPRQLASADLLDRLADVVAETGVLPALLSLEITESVLMDETDATRRTIDGAKELGLRLAIDDFGTGYSSLTYLKRFPVDAVKIDRQFVAGLGRDGEDAAIVDAVVGLAHALDLEVVAEGVEREEQLGELVRRGCDSAQGHFFSPPIPVDDLSDLARRIRRWRPPGATLLQARRERSA